MPKGKATIGDGINKKILGSIAEVNRLSEIPDFNNADKLGSGKNMVNQLTNLIAIFENPALDFSKNRMKTSLMILKRIFQKHNISLSGDD